MVEDTAPERESSPNTNALFASTFIMGTPSWPNTLGVSAKTRVIGVKVAAIPPDSQAMRYTFGRSRAWTKYPRERVHLMDIHQLELFLAVMNSPSMTRAAEKSHLSPGAVSLQLHNLADELNTELFVRRGKRLIPTPAAIRLAELAKQVVTMMGHIQQSFVDDLSKDLRPFHFATGVTTLIYQLGGPLRKLRKQFPNAEIRVTVGVTEPSARPTTTIDDDEGNRLNPK